MGANARTLVYSRCGVSFERGASSSCVGPCTEFLSHFFKQLNRQEQKLETKALSVPFLNEGGENTLLLLHEIPTSFCLF